MTGNLHGIEQANLSATFHDQHGGAQILKPMHSVPPLYGNSTGA
jgi:hypothetical protein